MIAVGQSGGFVKAAAGARNSSGVFIIAAAVVCSFVTAAVCS